jgi:hypothetical protein
VRIFPSPKMRSHFYLEPSLEGRDQKGHRLYNLQTQVTDRQERLKKWDKWTSAFLNEFFLGGHTETSY